MYGLTVTASAPQTSNAALAYATDVLAMSPRFASRMTGMPLACAASTVSWSARSPSGPAAS